ncbi:MAG: M56 family metallopeptidase [Planctomycetota bacterium]|nr:M56 family metallopeptidase [Planctomycetota bacterium]
MNALSPEVIERLGWVLIHSLWQFAVVAILSAVIVSMLRHRSATMRYGVLVVAMSMMVIAPFVTWTLIPANSVSPTASASGYEASTSLYREANAVPPADALTKFEETSQIPVSPMVLASGYETSAPMYREADAVPLTESMTEFLRLWFSWIVGGWLIGVLLCLFRPLLGWRTLRRLRRIGICPPSDEVLAAFARVSQRLDLRRAVQVFHSTLATGPQVVGYLRPIVLLPVSLVTSIPMPQLEAILGHELAHIRRHDFIINLAQTLIETLFYYHPAIWWLSHRIRVEREHCCDDLVVTLFDNGVEYGRALLAIEQFQDQQTVLALGAADGSLLGRIRRITGTTSHQPHFFPFLATAIALSAICGMWMVGQDFNVVADTQVNLDSIAAPEPESPQKPIQADLPTGVSVKLVGVTTPIVITDDLLKNGVGAVSAPVPNPDNRQWWSGDGLKLDEPPAAGRTWMVQKGREDGRQFAFEITGLPKGDSELSVEIFHLRPGKPPQLLDHSFEYPRIGSDIGTLVGSIAPDADADPATLELRIGSAEAATMKFDTDGERMDRLAEEAAFHSESMKQIIEEIKFLRIVQDGDNVELRTRPSATNDRLGYVFYKLLDKAGELHLSSNSDPVNNEKHTLFQDFQVDNIREVHCEIHAFHYSVTFASISRTPGTKTNVSVTVAPLPKPHEPIQARLPNGGIIELLGVSTPPIALPFTDKRDWWKGDGTTMDAAPIPRDSVHVGADRTDGREFVFRISEMAGEAPIHVTLNQRFKDGQPYEPEGNGWSMGSTQSGHLNGDPKASWQATIEHVAGPVGDADSATLELRIGSGTDAEMLFDVKGQRTNGDSKDEVWQLAAVHGGAS